MTAKLRKGVGRRIIRCQFCGYEGNGWKSAEQVCPRCGGKYNAMLAQEEDDD